MITFAELVDTIEHLSADERDELREILRQKKEEEIMADIESARKNSKEGKNVSFSSPGEIEGYFKKLMKDEDRV